eukprot:m.171126 g.171126  ORF g.171126 m.171126 type:complete len:243 (+) comp13336_c0_seq1:118-846(+)
MSGYGGRGYGGGYGGGAYDDDDSAGLIADHKRQENDQFMDQQFDDYGNIIRQRDEEVAKIESTMIEVNDIYRDLAQLVDEQGEALDNIENNMSLTDERVEKGAGQLVKASKYQKQARTKSIWCLGISLAVLAVVFVMAFGIPWKGGSSSGGAAGAATTTTTTPPAVQTTVAGAGGITSAPPLSTSIMGSSTVAPASTTLPQTTSAAPASTTVAAASTTVAAASTTVAAASTTVPVTMSVTPT